MAFFQIGLLLIYPTLFIGVLIIIFRWVNKFLQLKKEHNELLREIIRKMDQRP